VTSGLADGVAVIQEALSLMDNDYCRSALDYLGLSRSFHIDRWSSHLTVPEPGDHELGVACVHGPNHMRRPEVSYPRPKWRCAGWTHEDGPEADISVVNECFTYWRRIVIGQEASGHSQVLPGETSESSEWAQLLLVFKSCRVNSGSTILWEYLENI